MSRDTALETIANRILGCFGSVDLQFALHPSDEKTAAEMKRLVNMYILSSVEIEKVIRPKIENFLNEGYYSFGSNDPGPLSKDPHIVSREVNRMIENFLNYAMLSE